MLKEPKLNVLNARSNVEMKVILSEPDIITLCNTKEVPQRRLNVFCWLWSYI